MITRKTTNSLSVLCNAFLILPPVIWAHMEISYPHPLRSKFNPENSYNIIDYSMTSPLNADGSNFPCKGYQNDRSRKPTESYDAGSTYEMTLAGTATHLGGSCQISLSYDNGATFRVIKSMIGGCPLTSSYNFTVPSYAPSGSALLAWSWQNFEGNREFYMNCAQVDIHSLLTRRKRKRQAEISFDQLPYIWKANLEGVNECATTEAENPVYPNPGPDVIYGGAASSSDPPTPGECDAPTPYGQTYTDLGDTNQPLPSNPVVVSYGMSVTLSGVMPSTTAYNNTGYTMSQMKMKAKAVQAQTEASSQSYTTTTVTIDCPDTITVTVYPSATTITTTSRPSHYTTAAPSACTGTSASCPCANGYQCSELSPCTWACNAYATPTSRPAPPSTTHRYTRTTSVSSWQRSTRSASSRTWTSHSTWTKPYSHHSTVVVTRTGTVVPIQSTPALPPPPSSNHPPFASGDLSRYLPCVPGTFICTDFNTWQTCDQSVSGWVYNSPRDVAAGMECLPFLSPYSGSTSQHAQQGNVRQGYYRDDRIVRARPDGDCNDDGSILCTDGGTMFDICDHGGWVRMGPVAAGTTCQNGGIVAAR